MKKQKAKNRNQRISNSLLHFPMKIPYRMFKIIPINSDLHC